MNKIKHSLFILFVLIQSSAIAQSNNILTPVETQRIDSIMKQLMKKYTITGSGIGIVENNKIVYSKGYGFADRKNKIAATDNTIYGIGSITKTFTALAIMKLNEEGKIDLNKSAKDYLPDLKITSLVENGNILKIRNLLTHTSGLTDEIMNGDFCNVKVDLNTVIEELNKQVMTQPANWKMNYSNLGYDLLGLIIEKVSGKKYEDYIRENIISRLSMNNTGFQLKPNDTLYSKGYMNDSTETNEPELRDVPAGGLYSNVTDMSKFMFMILNDGKIGNDSVVGAVSVKTMESNHIQNILLNAGDEFGYGMFIEKMYKMEDSITGDGVGHAGDTYVYHSSMFMFPKMNIGIVVLTNSEKGHSFCNTSIIKLFEEYIQKVKGIQLHETTNLNWSSKALNNNITDYREVNGTYGTGDESNIKIIYKSKNKLLLMQDNNKLTMKKAEDNTFSFTYHVLGIFPIKIKNVKFSFEKIDNDIYLKQLSDRYKTARYISMKEHPVEISDDWKKAAGKYKVINACPGNKQGMPTFLKIVDGKIVLMVQFPGVKEQEGYSFYQLSNTLAAVDGIDRGSGMIMKILPDGHLYFSGYELVKE